MQRLVEFWNANRNEVLMTGLMILLIQVITNAGGFLQRRNNMRRLDEDESK